MAVKVSIIVPVYQTEAYLEKCLDSLVKQTLSELEIIVVNDGSPDQSQKIIDAYEAKYPQVKGYLKENGGLSDARNYGVTKAKGEYIAFVDSDDYIDEKMCAQMYEMAKQKQLDVVVCDTWMDYPNRSYVLKADLGYSDDPLKSYIMAYPNAPARMISRDLMSKIAFKKGIWYEDLDLMPTLVAYTDKLGFIHEPFYHYVQRDDSIMNQSAFKEKFYDIFVVLDDVYQVYKKQQLLDKYYLELEYLYIIQLQRSAVLRFAGLTGSKDALKKGHEVMKERFPHWHANPYLKKSSWKFRLICQLGRLKQYWLIALLKKVS